MADANNTPTAGAPEPALSVADQAMAPTAASRIATLARAAAVSSRGEPSERLYSISNEMRAIQHPKTPSEFLTAAATVQAAYQEVSALAKEVTNPAWKAVMQANTHSAEHLVTVMAKRADSFAATPPPHAPAEAGQPQAQAQPAAAAAPAPEQTRAQAPAPAQAAADSSAPRRPSSDRGALDNGQPGPGDVTFAQLRGAPFGRDSTSANAAAPTVDLAQARAVTADAAARTAKYSPTHRAELNELAASLREKVTPDDPVKYAAGLQQTREAATRLAEVHAGLSSSSQRALRADVENAGALARSVSPPSAPSPQAAPTAQAPVAEAATSSPPRAAPAARVAPAAPRETAEARMDSARQVVAPALALSEEIKGAAAAVAQARQEQELAKEKLGAASITEQRLVAALDVSSQALEKAQAAVELARAEHAEVRQRATYTQGAEGFQHESAAEQKLLSATQVLERAQALQGQLQEGLAQTREQRTDHARQADLAQAQLGRLEAALSDKIQGAQPLLAEVSKKLEPLQAREERDAKRQHREPSAYADLVAPLRETVTQSATLAAAKSERDGVNTHVQSEKADAQKARSEGSHQSASAEMATAGAQKVASEGSRQSASAEMTEAQRAAHQALSQELGRMAEAQAKTPQNYAELVGQKGPELKTQFAHLSDKVEAMQTPNVQSTPSIAERGR